MLLFLLLVKRVVVVVVVAVVVVVYSVFGISKEGSPSFEEQKYLSNKRHIRTLQFYRTLLENVYARN